jgi:4-hydroxybenzoate polyprenyltransferase
MLNIAAFQGICWWLNPLCLAISPVIWLVLLGYSYTKRFTPLCHLILGLALGLSPIGAWVAVTGSLQGAPWLLLAAILTWTAGFDIIYACQDVDFDRQHRLHSIPAWLGISLSLKISRVLHLLTIACLALWASQGGLGLIFQIGLVGIIALLIYEHSLLWGDRLERLDMAFFDLNGLLALLFGFSTILDILLRPH